MYVIETVNGDYLCNAEPQYINIVAFYMHMYITVYAYETDIYIIQNTNVHKCIKRAINSGNNHKIKFYYYCHCSIIIAFLQINLIIGFKYKVI